MNRDGGLRSHFCLHRTLCAPAGCGECVAAPKDQPIGAHDSPSMTASDVQPLGDETE